MPQTCRRRHVCTLLFLQQVTPSFTRKRTTRGCYIPIRTKRAGKNNRNEAFSKFTVRECADETYTSIGRAPAQSSSRRGARDWRLENWIDILSYQLISKWSNSVFPPLPVGTIVTSSTSTPAMPRQLYPSLTRWKVCYLSKPNSASRW